MQNAECRMRNAECRMRNAECRMQNAEFGIRNWFKPTSHKAADEEKFRKTRRKAGSEMKL